MMGYYSAIMAVIDFAGTDDSVYPPDEESFFSIYNYLA